MAVFRIERTRDYTVMSNHHLRNANLSLKAKGLLSIGEGKAGDDFWVKKQRPCCTAHSSVIFTMRLRWRNRISPR